MYYQNIKTVLLIMIATIWLSACSGDVGGNEDNTKPSVALTSLNDGEEVIGDFTITWETTETYKSTVDIHLSYKSGDEDSYNYTVVLNAPDTGSFVWNTNDIPTLEDCRNCRIRITPTDVVGNMGEPAESEEDFIINNIPQVLGVAFYTDKNHDGPGTGDTLRVPFDKELEIRTSIASEIFFFPVLGDGIGAFAEVTKGNAPSDLIITMNDIGITDRHLHVGGLFKNGRLNRTAPSGLNLQNDISGGILVARDTGRTAEVAELGIDIAPAFSDSGQLLGNSDTESVALGDVDGDGDLDMVTGNYNQANSVWLNNGGVFSDSSQVLGNSNTKSVDMGDVDGDGDLDLVAGNWNEPNRVWLNGGDNSGSNTGIFTDSGQVLGSNATRSVTLGDVDGDGDLDMVVGNFDANRVWLNGGDDSGSNTGVFTDSGQVLGNNNTWSVTLGDVDGDGDLDLVAGNTGGQANHVWINNINNTQGRVGVFTDSGQALGSSYTVSVTLGDVDGDGDLDLVEGNSGANLVRFNDGNGGFSDDATAQKLSNNFAESVALGDIDGDGDLDLVAGNFHGQASRVWINNINNIPDQEGVFTDSDQSLGSNDTLLVVLGDVDGDGDLDMVAGNYSGQANQVYLNSQRSTALFVDSGLKLGLGTNSTEAATMGDVDGDGDLDLVVGNFAGQPNEIWINNINDTPGQEGVFTDSDQALGSSDTVSVTLGDVDNDGDLDMVTGNFNGQANQIWINNINNTQGQEGVFTDSGQALGSSNTAFVALGDVDGDGDLDLVVGSYSGQSNRVWINNSETPGQEGVFTDSGQALGNNTTTSVALGDVDGDGDLDIVVGNDIQPNRVWLNGGDNSGSNTGVFTDSDQVLGNNDTSSVILGDVDGDNDLDLVEGNFAQPNRVWLNGGDDSGSNTGVFTDSGQLLGNDETVAVALDDVDGDGDLDLAEGNNGANLVRRNNGSGSFSDDATAQQLGNSNTESVILGDVDGDGDLDLMEGNGNKPHRVWLNDH